jgi:signal peptidase II
MKKKKADGLKPVRSVAPLFSAALLVLAFDQITKAFAIQYLRPGASVAVILNFFHLTFVENSGIAFGLFERHPGWLTVVITISVAVLFVYAWFFSKKSTAEQLAYGFILGGAFGNWVDRLRFQNVIDFLDFRIWPVFNLADTFITIGVVLFVWFALKGK